MRNDVLELLIESQSDRGKEDKIVVDWDSYGALRQVIERRINVSAEIRGSKDGATWADIAEGKINAVDSLDWLIARSLMRPRYLIQIAHECLGHAATVGHEKILEEDFEEGYRVYSLDIIGNTNYEIRDIHPAANDAIYTLINFPRQTTIGDIIDALKRYSYDSDGVYYIIRLFFWFGVLGAKTENGHEKYIYDYRYDEKIFHRVRQSSLDNDEPVYINLAFSRGLDCEDSA